MQRFYPNSNSNPGPNPNNNDNNDRPSEAEFICKICQKRILKQNQATHLASCKRNYLNTQNNRSNGGFNPNPHNVPVYYQNPSINPRPNHSQEQQQQHQLKQKQQQNQQKQQQPDHENTIDTIPCEICQKSIAIPTYRDHVINCGKAPEEDVLIPCDICNKIIKVEDYNDHCRRCNHIPTNNSNNSFEVISDNEEESKSDLQEQDSSLSSSPVLYSHSNQVPYSQGSHHQGSFSQGFFPPFSQGPLPHGYPFIPQDNSNSLSSMSNTSSNSYSTMSQPQYTTAQFTNTQATGNHTFQSRPNTVQQQQRVYYNNGQRVIERTQTDANGNVSHSVRFLPVTDNGSNNTTNIIINGNPMPMPMPMANIGINPNTMQLIFSFLNGGAMDLGALMQQVGQHENPLHNDIAQSLTTVKYDKEKSKNLDEECRRCAVCITDFEHGEDIKFLPCTHRFHGECIDPWFKSHSTCPLCKKDFNDLN